MHRCKEIASSFQSEDVQDTLEELVVDDREYEEMKESMSRMGKDLDQGLECSLLNKS
jgi:hypothetical protein